MRGSTLHRSGLTREKMGLLASLSSDEKRHNVRTQVNHTYKTAKNHELDILWGGVQKGIQKVHNATKTSSQKSPAVYLTIGFIAGVLFMSCITFIVSVSSMAPTTVANIETENEDKADKPQKANMAAIGKDTDVDEERVVEDELTTQEKYVVKAGDTLNGIAYRFYGKYDEAKIKEIQRINNLTNPEALRIDQELLIPVSQER